MEETKYMVAITNGWAKRGDEGEFSFSDLVQQYPGEFFERLRLLSNYNQDLLLSCFAVGKSGKTMGVLHVAQTYVYQAAVGHFAAGLRSAPMSVGSTASS